MAQGQSLEWAVLEAQMEATAKMRNASAAMIEAMQAQRRASTMLEAQARIERRQTRGR